MRARDALGVGVPDLLSSSAASSMVAGTGIAAANEEDERRCCVADIDRERARDSGFLPSLSLTELRESRALGSRWPRRESGRKPEVLLGAAAASSRSAPDESSSALLSSCHAGLGRK